MRYGVCAGIAGPKLIEVPLNISNTPNVVVSAVFTRSVLTRSMVQNRGPFLMAAMPP